MKRLFNIVSLLLLLSAFARAQSLQQIQPGDSLEQRRQKENSNFSLLNSKISVANGAAHTHPNKSALDTIPSTFGNAFQFLRLNSSHDGFEFATLTAGNGITISHSAGVTTISANAGNGITSLNGLTGSTQTFTNDTNVIINSSGSAHVLNWTGLLASSRGGTGNGFTKFAGASGSEKTYTLPNSSANILTDAAAVSVAQGGTGASTLTGLLKGNGTSAFSAITDSAGLAGAISDETGSGPLPFANGPTLDSPVVTTFLRFNAGAESRYYNAAGTFYAGFKANSSLAANKIWDLPTADGTSSQVLTTDGAGHLSWSTQLGSGVGEANTASNVGTGTGLFKQKISADLQFKSLLAGSTKVSITGGTNEVSLDVVEANLSHANIGGTTPVSKGGTGATSLTGIVVGNGTGAFTTVPAPAGAIVGTTDPQTLDHKTIDAEATGNTITLTSKVYLETAGCDGTNGSSNFDSFTTNSPTAACVVGTNTVKGVLDFPDGSVDLTAQRTIQLPGDWTGAVDVTFKWLTTATTGNVVWGIATGCAGDAQTDDPTFNNFNDVTDAAKGTASQLNDASITGVTMSGCAAGKLLHIKIARRLSQANDTVAATARLVGVEVTWRRAQ